ncbi:hypothetical protein [Actinoplanes sp. NPDC051851]|uniref:hypothetical protein n=1 Tax=Actinoplanes sp. NPDC051851 TaxID=3154753 RepID=UPI003432860B
MALETTQRGIAQATATGLQAQEYADGVRATLAERTRKAQSELRAALSLTQSGRAYLANFDAQQNRGPGAPVVPNTAAASLTSPAAQQVRPEDRRNDQRDNGQRPVPEQRQSQSPPPPTR